MFGILKVIPVKSIPACIGFSFLMKHALPRSSVMLGQFARVIDFILT